MLEQQACLRNVFERQDDAQNPFPDYETPPGKKVFQRKQAGKDPIRGDSCSTLVLTPPPKVKRSGSTDMPGSRSKKAKHATVDQGKGAATKTSKKLEQEFDEANESKDNEATKGSIASPKPKAKAKAKNKAKAASKNNTAPAKPSKDSENTSQTKPKKDSGNTSQTKPKKDSGNTSQTKPKKDSGNTAATKPTNVPGSEEEPKDGTARSSNDPMPRSPKKSQSKPAAKSTSPEKKKPGTSNDKEQEEQSLDEKKKVAHKMYMRFYRSVHSHSVCLLFPH